MQVMDGERSQGLELGLNWIADEIDAAAAGSCRLSFGLDLDLGKEDGGSEIDWDQFFFHEVDRCLSPGFSFTDIIDLQSPSSPEILEPELHAPSQLQHCCSPCSTSSTNSPISSSSKDDFQVDRHDHPNPHTSMDILPTPPPPHDLPVVPAPTVEDARDPVSKKRTRQIRNKDAAARSRERKKMYVRDLEMKSRYLEGECIRLNRLLHFFLAENHALRLSLHSGNAYGAPTTKQESAVLLMESLLLGSLLWFLGILCLLIPDTIPVLMVPATLLRDVEGSGRVSPSPRRAKSEMLVYRVHLSIELNRKYKASRIRIK